MTLKTWYMIVLATGILFATSTEAVAQSGSPVRLRDNPYRDDGGSCIYDRTGKLVSTPVGKTCRDRTNHLENFTAEAPSSLIAGFPPELREELRQLLGDHEHISTELTELRNAVEAGSRSDALGRVEKVGVEIADHRRREEEFLEKLSTHRTNH